MDYEQDGITYKIKDGLVKGWKGITLFKKPFWNGTGIVDGWNTDDEGKEAAAAAAAAARAAKLKDVVVVFEGVTKDGAKEFAVIVDDKLKMEVIEL